MPSPVHVNNSTNERIHMLCGSFESLSLSQLKVPPSCHLPSPRVVVGLLLLFLVVVLVLLLCFFLLLGNLDLLDRGIRINAQLLGHKAVHTANKGRWIGNVVT